jgi:hypothetical protein
VLRSAHSDECADCCLLFIALAMTAISAWNWANPDWPFCSKCFVWFRDNMEKGE